MFGRVGQPVGVREVRRRARASTRVALLAAVPTGETDGAATLHRNAVPERRGERILVAPPHPTMDHRSREAEGTAGVTPAGPTEVPCNAPCQ